MFSFNINAQEIKDLTFSAGINMANLTYGSDLKDGLDAMNATIKPVIGISVSADASFELSDILDLNTGLSFMQKGGAYSIDGIDSDISTKMNFIEINPSVSYNLSDEFSLYLGPYVGYALSGTQTSLEIDMTTGNTTATDEEINFEDAEYNRIDLGMNVGFSYLINEMINVSAGYSLGFADLNGADQVGDQSITTNGIRFSVGYSIQY